MKIRVTLKDPDTMHDAVDDAIKALPAPVGIDAEEWKGILETRADRIKASITHSWMEYSEYLVVDFDIDEKCKAVSATVVPVD